jgi:RND family efflux transporter MFP subunit
MSGRWGVIATALAAGVLAGCEAPEANPPAGPVDAAAPRAEDRVETHVVVLETLQVPIAASGSIEARRISGIGPEVPGRLVEVFVELGDDVEAGAPLFRVDPVPYELALAEARAGLSVARAEAANASLEARRVDQLKERRAASDQQAQQIRTRAAVARAQVARAETRVARAQRDLERTLVTAPYAGSIVERLAHEGSMASGEPVVVLQETGALEAILAIPEAARAPVRDGDAVRLFIEGRAAPLETRVTQTSDRVDPQTRTYEVRAPLEDAADVKAGSWVRAEVVPAAGEPRPAVDRSAVVMRDGRSYVFRVEGDRAVQVPVRLGPMNERRALVLDGVVEGDVVVRGEAVRRLTDGARVIASGDRTAALPPLADEATP